MVEENKSVDTIDGDTAAVLMGEPPKGDISAPPPSDQIPILDKSSAESGNANAPTSDQHDTGKQADQKGNQPPPQGQPAGKEVNEVSDDDLVKHLGFNEKPEEKLVRLDRKLAASSKESHRLIDHNKKTSDLLKDQGLELVVENGVPVGLAPAKGYSKDAVDFSVEFKNLPEDEQSLFETEPQKAVDIVIARARKAFTRAIPTIDRAIQPVSFEREEAAKTHLKEETWETGEKKQPDFDKNIGLVRQMIHAPDISKALKDFYNQEPEMATEYLLFRINAARSYVSDQARKTQETREKKETEARQTPPFGPKGGGTPAIGAEGQDIGDQIAGAGLGY